MLCRVESERYIVERQAHPGVGIVVVDSVPLACERA